MSAMPKASGLAVLVGTTVVLLAGCGGGAPPTPPPVAVAPATPAPVVRPKEPDAGKTLQPIAYEPKGRRDPFTPIFLGKDNAALSVSAVKLTGIVGGPGSLTALVEAPDGIGYILKPGDALGDGRVTGITPNSVTFAVSARGSQSASSLTLRLPENQ
jgi:Tfp pilus assembly protein PilP